MASEQFRPVPMASEVKLCPLPKGNDTESPYPLSIHGAWILQEGIEEYARRTVRMHEQGDEDASYCLLMTLTAIDEAEKLRTWARQVDPEYLASTIKGLDELLEELATQKERFAGLTSQEEAGQGKKAMPVDIDSLLADPSRESED